VEFIEENGSDPMYTTEEERLRKGNRPAILRALEAAGVEFIEENRGEPGDRPRKQHPRLRSTRAQTWPIQSHSAFSPLRNVLINA
jgi:hypothetical protein